MRGIITFTLISVLSLYPMGVQSWGGVGHSATAMIAATFLQENATSNVVALLGNATMASVSSWADNVRNNIYPWSSPFHYLDTPYMAGHYIKNRDCQRDAVGNFACVDSAIQNYTQRVGDMALSADERQIALKFLIHFIGDEHQPLHAGFITDGGGNSLRGSWFGSSASSNLHGIWDSTIIARRVLLDFNNSNAAFQQYLINQAKSMSDSDMSSALACPSSSNSTEYGACSDTWAQEGNELCVTLLYRYEDGSIVVTPFQLGEEYYERSLPVVERRLILAGLRMANVLNNVFPTKKSADESGSLLIVLVIVAVVIAIIVVGVCVYINRAYIFSSRQRSTTDDALISEGNSYSSLTVPQRS